MPDSEAMWDVNSTLHKSYTRYVGNVNAQIPAHGVPPVWQYISLPRGPVGPDQPPGVHLENRILRGWTHQMCRIRADIEPFEMV